jgi:hypothetical protein
VPKIDAYSRGKKLTFSNGVYRKLEFDLANRVSDLDITVPSDSGYDQAIVYGFNAASQITSKVVQNELYLPTDYGSSSDYSVNGLNQITDETSGGSTLNISYDKNGNLTYDGVTTFGYDLFNRLTSASGGTSFDYDATGRLYSITSSSANTYFLYDGQALIGEYTVDGSGNVSLQHRYIHGLDIDTPIVWYEGSTVSNATRQYLVRDELGSVVLVSDNNGDAYIMNNPLAGTDPSGYFCRGTKIGDFPDSVCGGEMTYTVVFPTGDGGGGSSGNGANLNTLSYGPSSSSANSDGSGPRADEQGRNSSASSPDGESDSSQSEAYDPDKHGRTPKGYTPPQNPFTSIICNSGCSVTSVSGGVGALLAAETGMMIVVDQETGLVQVFSYSGGGGSFGAQAFAAIEKGRVSLTTISDLSGLGYSANFIAAWNVGTTGQVYGGADLDNYGAGNGTIGATAGGVVGWGGGLTGLVTWTTYRGSYIANEAPDHVMDILRRVDN